MQVGKVFYGNEKLKKIQTTMLNHMTNHCIQNFTEEKSEQVPARTVYTCPTSLPVSPTKGCGFPGHGLSCTGCSPRQSLYEAQFPNMFRNSYFPGEITLYFILINSFISVSRIILKSFIYIKYLEVF